MGENDYKMLTHVKENVTLKSHKSIVMNGNERYFVVKKSHTQTLGGT